MMNQTINLNFISLSYNETNIQKQPLVIPKKIHRVWIPFDDSNPYMPARYNESDAILKSLHPDWQFIEWDENQVLNFIDQEYPEMLALYLSYDVPVKRHDFARYLILNKFGGVFIQHSFVFQKNIEPLLGSNQLVLSTKMNIPERKDELANNFIASVPNHPFWKFLFGKLVKSANIENVMNATGPFIFTKAFKEYQAKNHDTSIQVLDYQHLFPFYFFDKDKPEIKENCIDHSDLKQCFKLFPDIYAYCPWTSSWTNKSHQQAQVNLDLLNIPQNNTKIFVVNLKRSPERWEEISHALTPLGVEFERFEAVDGYNVKITDPETGKTYKGLDIKRKVINLPVGKDFYAECNNGVDAPVTITLKGYKARLMAGNIGVWCTKVLIRKRIIENKYSHTIIFEDDFKPNPNNFIYQANQFIAALPHYHIAYLHCHIKDRSTLVETNNSLVLSPGNETHWYGDWSYVISYRGAVALNKGYKFVGNSDDYSKTLARDHRITAYFASYNFSAVDSTVYSGHSQNSISTKMGCRDSHPSNPKDCDFNQVMPDQIYVINLPEEQERLELISKDLQQHNLKFTKFVAINGYQVQITNFQTNEVFFGIDIKNKKAKLNIHQQYRITCNPGADNKTEFNFTGYITNKGILVDAGALGIWCSNLLIWEDAKKNNYNRILVLEDDISLAANFTAGLETFSTNLPRTFHLAYLSFKLFTHNNTLVPINEHINGFTNKASGSRAHAIIFSANGIDKLLSLKDVGFKYPIDHFFWCLNTGKTNVFKYHPESECKQYIGFLETYASSTPLVNLNNLAKNSSLDRMGRADSNVIDFDNAFIITLNQSVSRYTKISNTFNSIGMPHTKFNAINGYDVKITNTKSNITFTGLDLIGHTPEVIDRNTIYEIHCNSDKVDFTLTGRKYNAREIGLWCSHFMIWKKAFNGKYNKTLVFEDDFTPKNQDSLVNDVNKFIKDLPTPFHLGYLHATLSIGTKIPLSGNLSHISQFSEGAKHWSAMAYCFSYQFAAEMMANTNFIASLDGQLSSYLSSSVYALTEDLYDRNSSFEASIVSKMGCREHHTNTCDFTGNLDSPHYEL